MLYNGEESKSWSVIRTGLDDLAMATLGFAAPVPIFYWPPPLSQNEEVSTARPLRQQGAEKHAEARAFLEEQGATIVPIPRRSVGRAAAAGVVVGGVVGGTGAGRVGAGVGGAVGVVLAPLTFGLSLPLGVVLGSCVFGAAGAGCGGAAGGLLGGWRARKQNERRRAAAA